MIDPNEVYENAAEEAEAFEQWMDNAAEQQLFDYEENY